MREKIGVRRPPSGGSRPVPIGSRSIAVSLQPAIPRQVAPQQSPLPLHRSPTIVAQSRSGAAIKCAAQPHCKVQSSALLGPVAKRECHLYFARRVTFLSCADNRCTGDGGLAIRSDLKEHELVATSGRDRAHPVRFSEVSNGRASACHMLHERHRSEGLRKSARCGRGACRLSRLCGCRCLGVAVGDRDRARSGEPAKRWVGGKGRGPSKCRQDDQGTHRDLRCGRSPDGRQVCERRTPIEVSTSSLDPRQVRRGKWASQDDRRRRLKRAAQNGDSGLT